MAQWRINNCPKCGGQLKNMDTTIKFCPYCGIELEKVIDEKQITLNLNHVVSKEIKDLAKIEREKVRAEKVKNKAKSEQMAFVLLVIMFVCIIVLVLFSK